MSTRSAEMESWLSVYPLAQHVTSSEPEDVIFVDVGGGVGHQCAALREKYPELTGRVIVQDLGHSIDGQHIATGVEGMAHDFFHTQPVKGMKIPILLPFSPIFRRLIFDNFCAIF
jgi:demethylsterigmatocystin 6-O-methyltransferase